MRYTSRQTTYTVTFSLNGGSGTAPSSQSVDSGTSIVLPAIMESWTKSEYAPTGWNTNSSGTGTDYSAGDVVIITANTTFYVKWSPAVTITFNKNGGTGTDIPSVVSISGNASTTLPNPNDWRKNNLAPVLWCTTSNGTGTEYMFGRNVSFSSSVTLYAIYATGSPQTTYYISGSGGYVYGTRGGAIKANQCIASPGLWDSGVSISYSYREYISGANKYTYYFPIVSGVTGGTTRLPTIQTKSSTESEIIYYISSFSSKPPLSLTSGTVSYIYYSSNSIAGVPAGTTNSQINEFQFSQSTSGFTAHSDLFGTILGGFYSKAYFYASTDTGDPLSVKFKNLTLSDRYSHQDTTYNITAGFYKTVMSYHLVSITLPSLVHSESYGSNSVGYLFIGWYVNGDDPSSYGTVDNLSFSFSGISLNSYAVIEARYTLNLFIVTFDANGGTVSPVYKTVSYNSTYGPLPTPTYAGATFVGWYKESSLTTQVTSSTLVTSTYDHTLYAKWTGLTQTVTFDGNGGTPSFTSHTYTVNSTYGTLPTCTYSGNGRTFAGWYTAQSGGTKITTSSTVSLAYVILYAHWTSITYTVAYSLNKFTLAQWQLNSNSYGIGGGTGSVSVNYFSDIISLTNSGTGEVFTKYSTATGAANTFYSFTLTANTTYSFSCTLSGTTTSVDIFLFYFTNNTSTGTYLSNNRLSFSHTGRGSSTCSTTFTTPANCTAAQIRFDNNTASTYAYFNKVTIALPDVGTLGNLSPTIAEVGDSFFVSDPTRTGYTFTGWTVTSGLNQANVFSISSWKANANSYALHQTSSGSLDCDTSAGTITITNSQSSGEVFTKWSSAPGAANTYYSMILIPNTQYLCSFSVASDSSTVSVDVYVLFFTDNTETGTYESNSYGRATSSGSNSFNFKVPSTCSAAQIRFDNNTPSSTVTISSIKITIPAKYGDSETPVTTIASSSTKCIVSGAGGVWFTNLRNTSGAVTLTANWTGAEYLLTVDSNNNAHTIVQKSPNLIYGSRNWNNLGALSRTGYTFNGYYDSPDTSSATQLYDSSGHNLASDYWTAAYDTGTFKGTSNLTVYAGWTANDYDIGYDNLFHYYGWVRTSSRGLNITTNGETLNTSSWWNADLTITSKSVQHIYTRYGNSNAYYNIPVEANTLYTVSCTFSGTSTNSQISYVELTSNHAYVKSSSPYYTETSASGSAGDKSASFTTSSTCAYIQLIFEVHDVNASMSFSNIRLCKTSLYTGVTLSAVRKAYSYNDDGNATIGTLITPTKSGYSFLGWYSAETGGFLIDANSKKTTVYINRTLYSRWSSTARTITFDANGGSGTMSEQKVANNTAIAIKSNAFTRTDYDFIGWSTNPSGLVQYENGANITLTDNQTLYAIWQPQVCYAFFNANGGTLPSYTDAGTEYDGARTRVDNLRICKKGDAIANNTNIFPTNKFRSRSNSSLIKATPVGDDIQVTVDASSLTSGYYYAGFYPYKNTVIPTSGKYTLVMELVSISSTNKTLSRLLITESNTSSNYQSQFETTYWTVDSPSAGTYLAYADGRALEDESSTDPTKLHYLAHSNTRTDHGGKLDCVVRVSIFGGTAIAPQSRVTGAQSAFSYVNPFTGYIRCPLPIPTRDGYVFDGWYANTSGTGTKYTDDTTISSSITLYAKWVSASTSGASLWTWEWT